MIHTPLANEYFVALALARNDTHLAILLRLMLWMCAHQQLLPLDRERCWAIAAVRTRDQQREFDRVMAEHFVIDELGRRPRDLKAVLHLTSAVEFQSGVSVTHDVTPALGGRYAVELASGVTPAEQNRARQKRHRDERKELEQLARANGHSPRKKATITELREMARVTLQRNDHVTQALADRSSRAPARGIPNTNTEQREGGVTPTQAGAACLAMKQAGLALVSPSHPKLQLLLDQGVTIAELADAAAEAVRRGKPFAYALAVAEGRRREAAAAAALPAAVDPLEAWAGPRVAAMLRGDQE